ncbi:SGNH/GDSL hydrolase family protein [Janibacter melonis]|uniref:SGNH/GDSL hydrolase family protein n=1 Tax=Janibacter melonis TaxID=262209 RepID=UPI002095A8EE|nr:SGNH/GDSL hydrolase family protein [Janibacter melonis]
MQAQPSGVRVAMTTTAGVVELVTHPTRTAYRGLPRPRGQVDLVVDGALVATDELTGGDTVLVDLATRSTQTSAGEAHVSRFEGLSAGEKRVELWLPHNEVVDLVELRADAPVAPVEPVGPRWLHHGSSISQGSNATSPARTWPSFVARGAGVELRNLGLGGRALVDPFMARVMRDTPADLVSVALGINVVNGDVMRLRSFVPAVHGFLDTIRDGHPSTPLVLVTPINCGIHEDTSGPGASTSSGCSVVKWASSPPVRSAATSSAGSPCAACARPSRRASRAGTTPTCTSSTGSRSTASRTRPSTRSPTPSTPTRGPTRSSPPASQSASSARAAPSPASADPSTTKGPGRLTGARRAPPSRWWAKG